MEVFVSNSKLGNVIRGHVLDVNKKHLEKKIKEYDPQLYLKWNPLKSMKANGKPYIQPPEGMYWRGFGHGCWELRRRPNEKRAMPTWEIGGSIVFSLEYVENEVENHIMDFQYLNYGIVEWIKKHDAWAVKNFTRELEYIEDKAYDRQLDKNQDDLRYNIKHERKAMRDFQDLIKSGKNPLEILGGAWG